MNRREFLTFLAGSSAALAVRPSGLLVPETVVDIDDRFRSCDDRVLVSIIDDRDRIAATVIAENVRTEVVDEETLVYCDDLHFAGPQQAVECLGETFQRLGVSIPLGAGNRHTKIAQLGVPIRLNGGDIGASWPGPFLAIS